jgi:hypothetical protein
MSSAMMTTDREQIPYLDDDSVSTSVTSASAENELTWTDSFNEMVQDVVGVFADTTISKEKKKKMRKGEIRSRDMVGDQENQKNSSELVKKGEVDPLEESVPTISSKPLDDGLQLDQVLQKTFYSVANFCNLYNHAQVRAETREDPFSCGVDEPCSDDNTTTREEAERRDQIANIPSSLPDEKNDPLSSGETSKTLPSCEVPGVTLAAPVVACTAATPADDNVPTSSGKIEVFESIKNALAVLTPEGGLAGGFERAMEAVVFPEKHLTIPRMPRFAPKNARATRTPEVPKDLLEDIMEDAHTDFCVTPVFDAKLCTAAVKDVLGDPSPVDTNATNVSDCNVIQKNEEEDQKDVSDRNIIQKNKEEDQKDVSNRSIIPKNEVEDQKEEDLAVGYSSAADDSCDATEFITTPKRVTFWIPPVDEYALSTTESLMDESSVISDYLGTNVILVGPWQASSKGRNRRKNDGSKRGIIGRFLTSRHQKV